MVLAHNVHNIQLGHTLSNTTLGLYIIPQTCNSSTHTNLPTAFPLSSPPLPFTLPPQQSRLTSTTFPPSAKDLDDDFEEDPTYSSVNEVLKQAKQAPSKMARAEFDYTAQGDEELTLREGDLIKVIRMEDVTWWYGELRGKTGMFPKDFVTFTKQKLASRIPRQKFACLSTYFKKNLLNLLKIDRPWETLRTSKDVDNKTNKF